MIVFGGSFSRKLAESVSNSMDLELGRIDSRRFPDGEFYVRLLSEVKDRECILIQTTSSNDAFMELFIILDLLRELNAKKIHTIVPYLGYSRQDKRFKEGEAFSTKTILKLIDQFSDSILTVNCHFLDYGGEFEFEGVRIRNLDAFPLVASYFRDKFQSPILISPDKGAIEYAKRASEIVNCDFDYLEKTRISDTQVELATKKLDVYDRDVIILDDMISTGATIIEAAEFIKKQGARSVHVGCVHGVFSNDLQKFKEGLDDLVCTDTIQTEVSKISVAGLISGAIKRIQ
jgi:ribose-phosphate pyrophosphokinase